MVFQLLLFGITKDIIGNSPFEYELEGENTAGNLMQQLSSLYPVLKELNSIAIAVNGEYATNETIIHEGDEIALIPPVSGG
jgi:molybdopterin synthase sulfur carrier subunit